MFKKPNINIMKSRIFTLLISVLLFSVTAMAQYPGPGSNWYFGDMAGCTWCTLQPNGDPLYLMDGQLTTNEGVATISDEQCNLLFYTDGKEVWNANHQIMANSLNSSVGGNLTGNSSSTQSGVIVPKPLDPNTYYIFSVDANIGSGGLAYSRVDMTMNGGLGDVDLAEKNVTLFNPSTEKIASCAHSNGLDIWVITHQWNNNQFNVYLVTSTGVQLTTPVINVIGQVHSGSSGNTRGYMKSSPNGTMLALGIEGMNTYEIFQFDNATGVLSNPIVLDDPNGAYEDCYGVEFSLSEQFLYGSERWGTDIWQWDVTTWSQPAIMATSQSVATLSSSAGGALQMAPDQKIYCARNSTDFLGRINSPDMLGTACNYVDQAILLGPDANQARDSNEGLPTFISSFFVPAVIEYETTCTNPYVRFIIPNAQSLDYGHWNFDYPNTDPAFHLSSPNDTVYFAYPIAGLYTVRLITERDNLFDTTFVEVPFSQDPVIDLGPDVTLCEDQIITYDLAYCDSAAIDHVCEYDWTSLLGTQTFYDTLPTFLIDKPGTYSVTVTSDSICGPAIDEIVVEYNNMTAQLGVDVTTGLCQGDVYTLDATYSNTTYGSTDYVWQNGSISPTFNVTATGIYSVTMTNGSVAAGYCTDIDSVYIEFDAPLSMPFADQTQNLCVGSMATLDAQNPDANYAWSTGLFTQTIDVVNPGPYAVTVTNSCGTIIDTVTMISLDVPPVDLGPDITICEGSPQVIDAYIDDCTYAWSTGDVMPQISVDTAGLFFVTVTNECGDAIDQIYVYADQDLIDFSLGSDTTVCPGFVLDCGYSDIEYYWSNNQTTQSIVINQSDDYGVDITNQCGTYSDVIHIDVIQMNLNLGEDQTLCPGSSIAMDAGNPGSVYTWSNGATTQTTDITQPGEVWVMVSNICETQFDTIQVDEYDMTLNIGADTALCEGETLRLDALHPGATYTWSNGATTQTIDVFETGVYALTVSHFCGDLNDEIAVDVNPNPVVDFGADTIYFVNGQDVTLDPQAIGASYEWTNGASDSVIVVTTNEMGPYGVTVTSEDGCVGTGQVYVKFPVGIDEFGIAGQIKLYPNPAKDKLFISIDDLNVEEIRIYNALGSLMAEYNQIEETTELTVNNLSEGVYFVKILTDKNEVAIKPFSVVK